MRISAIVAGSIITGFCSPFRNVATGMPNVSANRYRDSPSRLRMYYGEMIGIQSRDYLSCAHMLDVSKYCLMNLIFPFASRWYVKH